MTVAEKPEVCEDDSVTVSRNTRGEKIKVKGFEDKV